MFGFDVELTRALSRTEEETLRRFLGVHGLSFEGKPDVTVFVKDPAGRVAATGSLAGDVIRMVAVDPSWQEAGLSGVVVSRLVEVARERGKTRLFVYTKPDSALRFKALGFLEIARVEGSVVLMEMGEPGISAYRPTWKAGAPRGGRTAPSSSTATPSPSGTFTSWSRRPPPAKTSSSSWSRPTCPFSPSSTVSGW